jgi:hypothetical protein
VGVKVLRVIEESVEHRSRRERETDRVHITSHPRPLFRENRKGFEGAHPRKGVHPTSHRLHCPRRGRKAEGQISGEMRKLATTLFIARTRMN